jgi:hypothetical protein
MATPGREDRPALGWLIAVGGLSLVLYGAVAVLGFRFRYGEGHADRPILEVLALLGAATLGWLAALKGLLSRQAAGPGAIRVVLLFAVLYRLVLLPSQPIQEIDFYRYLWDGRVCLHGLNPYRYAPAQVERGREEPDAPADLAALGRLSTESPAVHTIFERVHHRDVPTVYPPAAQAVFAAAAALTPADSPLPVHVLVLKTLLLLLFDLATVFLLAALLHRLGLPPAWCAAYGWCPLVLKEVVNSGHLDSLAVFFTIRALYALVAAGKNRRPALVSTAAFAALGVAILAKSYPVILLPVVAAFAAARLRGRVLLPLAACAAVAAAGYLPVCGAAPRAPDSTDRSHHPWAGLGIFLTRWQMNDLPFMLVHENLRRPGSAVPDRRFVVAPADWREALHEHLLSPAADAVGLPAGTDPAFLLAQGLMGLVLLGLCLHGARGVWRRPESATLLRAALRTLAWGWLLSSAPNPWYLLWCLPLIVFDGRRSWFLLPGLVLLYYLRFWLAYRAPDAPARAAARDLFDFGVVWLEYLPFLLALAAESAAAPLRRLAAPLARGRLGPGPAGPLVLGAFRAAAGQEGQKEQDR